MSKDFTCVVLCTSPEASRLVRGFGGHRASGGANEEPLGGAADAAPGAAASSDAQGVVAFAGERGGFLAFVAEVALGCGELRLASFAVDGEVVERFQVFGGNDGVRFWRWGVRQCGSGLQNDWGRQGNLAWEFAHNLRRRHDGAFLGCQSG